jgi:Co/Zn/Cd efflux system component/copper chaperone CopZ
MRKTISRVPKMDCAADERLVRMALEGRPGIRRVDVDLSTREVSVVHDIDPQEVDLILQGLNLGSGRSTTTEASELDEAPPPSGADEARTLKIVMAINAGMFAAEAVGAILADSSALLADSLDMFADAAEYGIALFGVHRARTTQLKAARLSGVFQVVLAVGALGEVVRRVVFGSEPETTLMVVVALAAFTANVTSMWLLARHRHGGAHMKASWIFTTNDVIANLGVMVAAGLVRLSGTNVPDLVVATVIALVVLNGAIRILRLKE